MVFLDTSIWVYGLLVQDKGKHARAQKIIADALQGDGYAISTQVLAEYASVMLRKAGKSARETMACLECMELVGKIVPVDVALAKRAVEVQSLYGLQFYDAQIVAAAECAGCAELWSEDLGDGQSYCGVRCMNPLRG